MTKTFFLVSDTSERDKVRDTTIRLHQTQREYYKVPERVIGKHQNDPEKRPVFHAERRNEEGEEHGEEGGVHRWNAASLGISLSLALLSARAEWILFKAKLNTFLFVDS